MAEVKTDVVEVETISGVEKGVAEGEKWVGRPHLLDEEQNAQ